MCPTLEQILSRSLMRGKIPLPSSASSSGMKEVNLSSIPSLRVPQAKPAPVHRTAASSAGAGTNTSSDSSQSKTKKSTSTTTSSGNSSSTSRQDSVVAAFAGLSTPHFSPDPREKISERPVRGGLRALQDLPSLLESACILDEWKSALRALDDAIDLVTGAQNSHPFTSLHHQQHQQTSSLFSIRKLIPLSHFVAAARVCQSNGAAGAFEKCMNDKILQLADESHSLAKEEEAESKSTLKKNMKYDVELSEITTETLVESGSWELALQRYEKLCQEGKQTVGSLNSCISACSAKPQLWLIALKLAEPAMAAREAEMAENLILNSNNNNNNGEKEDKNSADNDKVHNSSSSVPLSHFGSSTTNAQKITDVSSIATSSSSSASANAITYAALISTLENCGRPVEAAKILKSAPTADREVVMASYVALLKVWSDTHGKKSMRRF